MKRQKITTAVVGFVLVGIFSACDSGLSGMENKANKTDGDGSSLRNEVNNHKGLETDGHIFSTPIIKPSIIASPPKKIENIKDIKNIKKSILDYPKNFDLSTKSWYVIRNMKNELPSVNVNIEKMLRKYNAYYHMQTAEKKVYLTFDEGYENGYTESILDTLKSKNVKASFFITGQYLRAQKKLVERILAEGHGIENHTMNHPSLQTLDEKKFHAEVGDLHKMVKEEFGVEMKYIRPPKGEYNEKVLYMLNELGYKTVFWGFAYDDYDVKKQKGREYAHRMIMDNLHSGEIMLLHAVSKDNKEVLSQIIEEIQEKGYKIGKLE